MNADNSPLSEAEHTALLHAAEHVRRDASRQLAALAPGTAVVRFITTLHQGVDRVVNNAVQHGVGLACAAGCSHCCSTQVSAQPVEALLIAQALRELDSAAQTALVQRLRAHGAALAQTAPNAAWNQRPPCAFLVGGLCTIYAVRPAACRKAHSLDVAPCAASSAHIPQSMKILAGAEALMQGMAGAYVDQGLQAQAVELCSAVLQALIEPDAAGRWQAGQAVF
jgi:uncharacterized protein